MGANATSCPFYVLIRDPQPRRAGRRPRIWATAMQKRFKTNLRCTACVEKIAPIFNNDRAIRSWSADVAGPDKLLTVDGDSVDSGHVGQLLAQAGYQSLGEIESP